MFKLKAKQRLTVLEFIILEGEVRFWVRIDLDSDRKDGYILIVTEVRLNYEGITHAILFLLVVE